MSDHAKKVLFEVQLDWVEEKAGRLSAPDVNSTMVVETPPAFGGKGGEWSPEHLFIGAVSTCLMSTYLSFADRFKFQIKDFRCQAIGIVELVDGKFRFTHVDLFPVIIIHDESVRDKALLALEKTKKYCLVTNSLNCSVEYHGEVRLESEDQLHNTGPIVAV